MDSPTVAQTPVVVNVSVGLALDEATVNRLLEKWVREGADAFTEEGIDVRRGRVFAILRQCFYLLQSANVDPMEYLEALVQLGAVIPKEASR